MHISVIIMHTQLGEKKIYPDFKFREFYLKKNLQNYTLFLGTDEALSFSIIDKFGKMMENYK